MDNDKNNGRRLKRRSNPESSKRQSEKVTMACGRRKIRKVKTRKNYDI